MNIELVEKVKGLVDDINLIDYVDRTELQIAKDRYVDEVGEIDDSFEFGNWLEEEGVVNTWEEFDQALNKLLDNRLIYTSACIGLLQADLLDTFEILEEVNAEGLIEFTSFDVHKFAWAVAHYICYSELRSDLEFAFIDNALGELK